MNIHVILMVLGWLIVTTNAFLVANNLTITWVNILIGVPGALLFGIGLVIWVTTATEKMVQHEQ